MSETLRCSRCGRENPSERLFCQGCGLGLRLLATGGDAPVGWLYARGLLGGLLAFLLSAPLFWGLLAGLQGRVSPEAAAPLLTLYLWRLTPLLFVAGAAWFLTRAARRAGLPASGPLALLGGWWLLGLCFVAALWAGEWATVAGCLISPFGCARLGLGLFAPWTPGSRLALWTVGLLIFSALLAILSQP